jgi:peptide-methionine (R)-S-oxide reductase
MHARRALLSTALLCLGLSACPARVEHTDAEWRALLSQEQFRVLREGGTEVPFSGPLNDFHDPALFVCAGCGQLLFSSEAKFDSHTGWPSFWEPVNSAAVKQVEVLNAVVDRAEVRCPRCGGHLGHVFADGPKPTGLRYCINSAALKAVPMKGGSDATTLWAWLGSLFGSR